MPDDSQQMPSDKTRTTRVEIDLNVRVGDRETYAGMDYELKGSGLSCWAECECGEKLAGEHGPIVGSRGKIEEAIK